MHAIKIPMILKAFLDLLSIIHQPVLPFSIIFMRDIAVSIVAVGKPVFALCFALQNARAVA